MTRKKKPDPVTDGRKRPGSMLPWWARRWNPALIPVADFIAAVDDGETPKAEDMQHVAAAMREMFCHRDTDVTLQAMAKKLGLKRKQGKRGLTAVEALPTSSPVLAMVKRERELIAQGVTQRTARAQAVREVAAREGIPMRTAQERRRVHGAWCYSALIELDKINARHAQMQRVGDQIKARRNSRSENPG